MYFRAEPTHWSKYRWEFFLITSGSRTVSQTLLVTCFKNDTESYVPQKSISVLRCRLTVTLNLPQHAWTAWGMLVRWLTLHSKMSAGLIASLFWMSFCILPWLTEVCSSFYAVAVRIFWFKAAATECFCAFQLLLLVVTAHNLIVLLPVSIYFMSSCRRQLFSAN